MNFRKLLTYLTVGTAAVIPFAGAQNPTILQGNYITNVFGNSNFVLNPNAQTNVANVTNATRSTTTPLVATSEFNLNLTSGSFATWTLRAFDAGMKGQNCEARFTYRGFAATSKVHIKQGANTVASLNLTPATDPRIASINFPCGDLSNPTTFVVTDTAILAGTNEIGGIYVGLATNMANVAQAEFVGSLRNFNPSGGACNWSGNGGTAIAADADCSTYQKTGLNLEPSTKVPAITFTAPRSGTYQIAVHAYIGATGVQTAECQIYQNNTLVQNLSKNYTSTGVTSNENRAFAQFAPELTSGTAYTFDIRCNVNNVILARYFEESLYWTVYRFPSSSELVVTPERQNTFGSASWPVGNSGSIYSFSTTSTTAQNVVNTGFASGSGSYYGAASASATTNGYGMKVNNIPPGVYRITAQVSVSQPAAGGYDCSAELHDNSGRIGSVNSGLNTKSGLVVIYRVTSFQTSQDFLIKLRSDNASLTCTVNTGNGGVFNPSIVFEPLDQPSNSALYVQGPVLGARTGAAIPAGYVGETLTSGVIANTATPNGTWVMISSGITLQPGVWLVSGQCDYVYPAANLSAACLISTTNSTAGAITPLQNWQQITWVNGTFPHNITMPSRIVTVTTPTLLYFGNVQTNVASASAQNYLQAIRLN